MKKTIEKFKHFIPALAFFGGFAWDSITLGRMVYSSDLLFLLAYYFGALILVILLSASKMDSRLEEDSEMKASKAYQIRKRFLNRDWSEKWTSRFTWAVQFCFGSLFSALVICYFKSSGSWASLFLVLFMTALLIGNEFLQRRYESFTVSLSFFCLLGTMFLNFAIPHWVHRLGWFWFLLSTTISFLMCYGIWKLSLRPLKVILAPFTISCLLIVMYFFNVIPPVPLVVKQHSACIHFDRTTYSCEIDNPSVLELMGLSRQTLSWQPSEGEVYFLSSIFAPNKVKANIEHRWFYLNPKTEKFELTDRISSSGMSIQGGRESGFRTYTKKKNLNYGRWKVETAFKDGAVIGSKEFEVRNDVFDGQTWMLQ